MDEIKVLTEYIAIWFNHTMALMFFIASTIMFALPRTLITSTFYLSFFIVFAFWEIKTFRRKRAFENDK